MSTATSQPLLTVFLSAVNNSRVTPSKSHFFYSDHKRAIFRIDFLVLGHNVGLKLSCQSPVRHRRSIVKDHAVIGSSI